MQWLRVVAVVAPVLLALAGCDSVAADGAPLPHAHIIAHSHCDPGWLDTFEGYYQHNVERILNDVLERLSENPTRRFVWAEISFFSR